MSEKQAPVSVIIPCYRCAESVGRAVASVAAQTLVPAEVILVDDGSGDGTVERLQALSAGYQDGWVRVLELPDNCGPGTARNAGWEKATQQYVAFLDADDSWHRRKVELQYLWMEANPFVVLTGHACFLIDDAGSEKLNMRLQRNEVSFRYVSPLQCLVSNRFPTRSVMLKRGLPHRFAHGKRHSEDFLLWCDICLDGYSCCRSEAGLAFMYKAPYGEGGLSKDLWKMQKGQMDTYIRLRRSGRVTWLSLPPLLVWSVMRFARRLIIKGARSIYPFLFVAKVLGRRKCRP